jgi:hypothetical protein
MYAIAALMISTNVSSENKMVYFHFFYIISEIEGVVYGRTDGRTFCILDVVANFMCHGRFLRKLIKFELSFVYIMVVVNLKYIFPVLYSPQYQKSTKFFEYFR